MLFDGYVGDILDEHNVHNIFFNIGCLNVMYRFKSVSYSCQ